MKSTLLVLTAACLLGAAAAFSGTQSKPADIDFKLEDRNPVSHLRLNKAPGDFQFAVVSDRTGGHRARVFSQAVDQINLLQPEFVVSVGDLIEGYTESSDQAAREWREFQGYLNKLQMPFFYVPGNHDLANKFLATVWGEKFGRSYYHFVYRDVLFLMVNSEDPPGKESGSISAVQQAYFKTALEQNASARWTIVFLHKPIWVLKDVEKTGWLEIEKLLAGRPHTVLAGHLHQYKKFIRNGNAYYQLATTGGASRMRGLPYGEFDHLVWVTMKKEGPVLANVLLDGIYREDMTQPVTGEESAPEYNRKPTQPVSGMITLQGKPIPGAMVAFQSVAQPGMPTVYADSLTDAEGRYVLSTYHANDGAPVGEYLVTVQWRRPLRDAAGNPGPNQLPERFASSATSGLKATVARGQNSLNFDLNP